jgi:hypothetical protein
VRFLALRLFLLLIGMLVLLVIGVVHAVRSRRTGSWPWAESSIKEHSITVRRSSYGRILHYKLTVSYSYSVGGITYAGTYSEICQTYSAAEECFRSLQDLPPPVRYKPGKPQVSAMDPYRDAGLKYTHPHAAS